MLVMITMKLNPNEARGGWTVMKISDLNDSTHSNGMHNGEDDSESQNKVVRRR